MKKTWILLSAILIVLCMTAVFCAAAESSPTLLTIYEGPKTMTSSRTAAVSVNGYELFVYDVMVNHEHIWNANTQPTTTPMTYFDFSGKVLVEIRMPGLSQPVEKAEVLPSSWAVSPSVEEGTVRFMITEPG